MESIQSLQARVAFRSNQKYYNVLTGKNICLSSEFSHISMTIYQILSVNKS